MDDNRLLQLIGMKVKTLRQRKRMSQQELAELVGYGSGKSMISLIESGKVNFSMDKLVSLSNVLGIRMSDLLSDDLDCLYEKSPENKTVNPLEGLDPDDMKRVAEYIKILKGARAWQNQNGTDKDGDTASRSTAKLGPTLQEIPDEEADLMFSTLQSESPDSRQSKRSGRHGKDTSLRLMR